ncbi:endoglucanase 4-like [Ylistrum balloti]|uniref:endoglucanase 4-like n=1 Tax=Ylistrum balloti TaxID=509963 RepID=UPI00290582A1|nr:endoglucanase 4-like [Ylistrum balloti]
MLYKSCKKWLAYSVIFTFLTGCLAVEMIVKEPWPVGNHFRVEAKCSLTITEYLTSFHVYISFDRPTTNLEVFIADERDKEPSGLWYYVQTKYPYGSNQSPLDMVFHVDLTTNEKPSGVCSEVNGDRLNVNTAGQMTTKSTTSSNVITTVPSTTRSPTTTTTTTTVTAPTTKVTAPTTKTSTSTSGPTTPTTTTTTTTTTTQRATGVTSVPPPYDYGELLRLSILFYAAQRSGDLPDDNPISYRKDSALTDQGDNGRDLVGGFYDAGDYVKFNFPMAASVTLLTWGLITWPDAYASAGQLDSMYDCIKWPLDYFVKCWDENNNAYYTQVGNGIADHAYWGQPENMTMARPALKLTANKPGSDVAGETAAAMAAGAIAFKSRDPAYSDLLLNKAKTLYTFAKMHRGKYSDSFPEIREFYGSSGYEDELALAAAWLYKATQVTTYLAEAQLYYSSSGTPWALSWDSKTPAVQILLYNITREPTYRSDILRFLESWQSGNGLHYTPQGLAWRDQWGSLRYTGNTALVALMAVEQGLDEKYRTWAQSQIHYMVGDNYNEFSYVIGFGNDFPRNPHHASSSCPVSNLPCGWSFYNDLSQPNHHVLLGALVGGPSRNDEYEDKRTDYIMNEVTCDYNAGFQSAVAGLLHFHVLSNPVEVTTMGPTPLPQQTPGGDMVESKATKSSSYLFLRMPCLCLLLIYWTSENPF